MKAGGGLTYELGCQVVQLTQHHLRQITLKMGVSGSPTDAPWESIPLGPAAPCWLDLQGFCDDGSSRQV